MYVVLNPLFPMRASNGPVALLSKVDAIILMGDLVRPHHSIVFMVEYLHDA